MKKNHNYNQNQSDVLEIERLHSLWYDDVQLKIQVFECLLFNKNENDISIGRVVFLHYLFSMIFNRLRILYSNKRKVKPSNVKVILKAIVW